jgi:uncharacterized protein YbjT (DUF2867 family)
VGGDALAASTLVDAMRGVEIAYYLIHSMGGRTSFVEKDRAAATHFGAAAAAAGVRRIVYVGGLGDSDAKLSPHLASRHETGELLRRSGVEVVELRASIVIGAGSLSFELVRSLVEKLPLMMTPRWVRVQAQPIAIADLLDYLVEAKDIDVSKSGAIFQVGGQDIVSYQELMLEYARLRGLRRIIIPIPLLTPWLSSLWLGLVTPVFARVGRKLIDSVRHPTVVTDHRARDHFTVCPMGLAQAIAAAISDEDQVLGGTRWSDSLAAGNTLPQWGGTTFGSRIVDHRRVAVEVDTVRAFAPIQRIGGQRGWYFATWLWRIRGLIDLLVGGVGLRRGRRHPVTLRAGDVIDWWRVEEVLPGQVLRLSAEMRVPGRAWLQFEVKPRAEGGSEIHQTAIFDPLGVWGRLYWYGIYPVHVLVFRGMISAIARAAEHPDD